MDNETKMMLLDDDDASYWDILPPELKEMILQYRESQELIERRESYESRELCFDILGHGLLRREWFIGPIQCKLQLPKHCRHRPRCYYMKIYGHYWDLEGDKKRVFLGYDFDNTIPRCALLKTDIEYQTNPDHTLSVSALSLR